MVKGVIVKSFWELIVKLGDLPWIKLWDLFDEIVVFWLTDGSISLSIVFVVWFVSKWDFS